MVRVLTLVLLLSAGVGAAEQEGRELPLANQRHIEALESRIHSIERQLDRIEAAVNSRQSTTDNLLYILFAVFGIDKGSYWIKRRLNGSNGKKANS